MGDTRLSLSTAMRVGSTTEHREAEDSAFLADLLDGRVDAQGYAG